MFVAYRNNSIITQNENDRLKVETYAKEYLVLQCDRDRGITYVTHEDTKKTVVSILTDDANGLKIHRLDGWEPPEPQKCNHRINQNYLALQVHGHQIRLVFRCDSCHCDGYIPIAEYHSVEGGSPISWRE